MRLEGEAGLDLGDVVVGLQRVVLRRRSCERGGEVDDAVPGLPAESRLAERARALA